MTAVQKQARTLAEVAHTLGISQRTVKRRVADGQIRVIRLGRIVRVAETEMERLLGPK